MGYRFIPIGPGIRSCHFYKILVGSYIIQPRLHLTGEKILSHASPVLDRTPRYFVFSLILHERRGKAHNNQSENTILLLPLLIAFSLYLFYGFNLLSLYIVIRYQYTYNGTQEPVKIHTWQAPKSRSRYLCEDISI